MRQPVGFWVQYGTADVRAGLRRYREIAAELWAPISTVNGPQYAIVCSAGR